MQEIVRPDPINLENITDWNIVYVTQTTILSMAIARGYSFSANLMKTVMELSDATLEQKEHLFTAVSNSDRHIPIRVARSIMRRQYDMEIDWLFGTERVTDSIERFFDVLYIYHMRAKSDGKIAQENIDTMSIDIRRVTNSLAQIIDPDMTILFNVAFVNLYEKKLNMKKFSRLIIDKIPSGNAGRIINNYQIFMHTELLVDPSTHVLYSPKYEFIGSNNADVPHSLKATTVYNSARLRDSPFTAHNGTDTVEGVLAAHEAIFEENVVLYKTPSGDEVRPNSILTMYAKDQQAKFYGFLPGDILKVFRNTGMDPTFPVDIVYRKVIES